MQPCACTCCGSCAVVIRTCVACGSVLHHQGEWRTCDARSGSTARYLLAMLVVQSCLALLDLPLVSLSCPELNCPDLPCPDLSCSVLSCPELDCPYVTPTLATQLDASYSVVHCAGAGAGEHQIPPSYPVHLRCWPQWGRLRAAGTSPGPGSWELLCAL